MKYYEYVTLEGDTFDSIALDFYDDEFKATELMKANPVYISTLVFSAGIKLKIPEIEIKVPTTLPPWKRG